jgi:hypothetical protein
MIRPTGNPGSKLIKNPNGWILDRLVVVTVATANAEILVRRSAVEPAKGYVVVSVPCPIYGMMAVKA